MKPVLAALVLLLPLAATAQEQPKLYQIGDQLLGTKWQVQAVDGETIPPELPVTLAFEKGNTLVGQSGCSHFKGPFASRQEHIVFGPFEFSVVGDCEPGMDDAARLVTTALTKSETARFDGSSLLVKTYASKDPVRLARLGN
ncbi:MAG: META domain-containing protein [Geminicoccaceae bacterium]